MKYILILLSINIIFCAYRSLTVNDYKACERGYVAERSNDNNLYNFKETDDGKYEKYKEATNGEECNKRWNPSWLWKDGDGIQAYPSYACCYVQYEMRGTEFRSCYLMEDIKKQRNEYIERVLGQFEKVKVKCASSYLHIGTILLVFALLF